MRSCLGAEFGPTSSAGIGGAFQFAEGQLRETVDFQAIGFQRMGGKEKAHAEFGMGFCYEIRKTC